MAKYICLVCGYAYDESKGIPEAGIKAGTLWSDLPEDWLCPLCGAAKSEFKKETSAAENIKKPAYVPVNSSKEIKELNSLEISALCSNLARGCEKQYKADQASQFTELASYFKAAAAPPIDPSFEKILSLVDKDLEEGFPYATQVSTGAKDRGALRALVWSEKVTRILKSLLSRYEKEGEAMLQNTGVYVCTICGFIFIGDVLPDICPVCKVPNWKFEKVEGR